MTIPSPFYHQALFFIPKIEVKLSLTRILPHIDRLTTRFAQFEPDPKILAITTRFYRYFKASCESPQKMAARSVWLLHYAMSVYHHLSIGQSFPSPDQSPSTQDEYLLHDQIVELAARIADYQVSHPASVVMQERRYEIQLILDDLVQVGRLSRLQRSLNDHWAITRTVEHLSQNIHCWSMHGLVVENDGDLLLARLRHLSYLIDHPCP